MEVYMYISEDGKSTCSPFDQRELVGIPQDAYVSEESVG